ncbi:MAG TPA: hypothetical protein P5057_09100, partial [Acidobacteriota bacterium]|nr:hypothetical protein [Acidobacteriota bacterium]
MFSKKLPALLLFAGTIPTWVGGQTHPSVEHVVIYHEPGMFGGWPANHGIWIWGDEILVGFSKGYYKNLGDRHHIDREKPEHHMLARSLDGG